MDILDVARNAGCPEGAELLKRFFDAAGLPLPSRSEIRVGFGATQCFFSDEGLVLGLRWYHQGMGDPRLCGKPMDNNSSYIVHDRVAQPFMRKVTEDSVLMLGPGLRMATTLPVDESLDADPKDDPVLRPFLDELDETGLELVDSKWRNLGFIEAEPGRYHHAVIDYGGCLLRRPVARFLDPALRRHVAPIQSAWFRDFFSIGDHVWPAGAADPDRAAIKELMSLARENMRLPADDANRRLFAPWVSGCDEAVRGVRIADQHACLHAGNAAAKWAESCRKWQAAPAAGRVMQRAARRLGC